MKIQLKRSNQLDGGNAKAPTATQMQYGELAVNYNQNDPALFIKVDTGNPNSGVIRIAGANAEGDSDTTYTAGAGLAEASSEVFSIDLATGGGLQLSGTGNDAQLELMPASAGQALKRNSGNTAWEAYTPADATSPPNDGQYGHWTRNNTDGVLSPATAGDDISTSGDITLTTDDVNAGIFLSSGTDFSNIVVGDSLGDGAQLDSQGLEVASDNVNAEISLSNANRSVSMFHATPMSIYNGVPALFGFNDDGPDDSYNVKINNSVGAGEGAGVSVYGYAGNAITSVAYIDNTGRIVSHGGELYITPYGSTATSVTLTATGNGTFTGDVTANDFNSTSDAALKMNINPIDNALEMLNQITGVTFDWKANEKSSAGVLAQDVENVLPSIVGSNNEHKTVNYNGLVGLLVQAVKELSDEVKALKG